MPDSDLPWHTLTADEALTRLASAPGGLTPDQAAQRLASHGPNRLPTQQGRGPLRRFAAQFHNVLIYVLLAAGTITGLLGHWVDMSVILGVVVINAVIGFLQEGKAERALDAIRGLLSTHASVVRAGQVVTIDAREVVPGDVVQLQSGDRVPADLRLLRVRNLRVDESALTGESVPVEKDTHTRAAHTALAERTGMAYSGTLVTFGQAVGVCVATGADTEIGRISGLLAQVQPLTTPLLRQMAGFATRLSYATGALALFTFAFGLLVRDYRAEEMFLAAVGLAVAAIPEGLPAVVTITLAIGVQRMAGRNAIVRRLPAVETLGSVTVICTDKTGTLTRNEMTARTVVTAAHAYAVTGVGYDPHGQFNMDGRPVELDDHPLLRDLCRAVLLCNDARIEEADGRWRLHGDPTEGALVTLAHKAGLDRALADEEFPRTDVIPFESEHQFMATLHHDHRGHGFIILKGAPERVLEMCASQRTEGGDLHPLDLAAWRRHIHDLAGQGQRLLAVALRPADSGQRELRFDDVAGGLTLLGIVGLIDPPRDEAIAAVAECRRAGIRVKMITGDHQVTARAIATQMGIGDGMRVLTGRDLAALDDAALAREAAATDVFARAAPEDKLRLVQALQACGQVVAMTGDGVNDAPALRRADVGVAMGVNGTEVAKEAAEMVLADDNFASIAAAVREGRTVYDNLKKAILFILPTNGAEAFIIVAAILLGLTLPITPVQILWVNMVAAVSLALALAFEPPEPDSMRRPPRDSAEPLLSGFLLWRVVLVSAIFLVGTFGLFLWQQDAGLPVEHARTVAVNTLVMAQVFYLFNTRYIAANVLSRAGLLGNGYVLLAAAVVILLQLLFTYAPPMQHLFATSALSIADWGLIIAVAAGTLALVELEKLLLRRLHRGPASARATAADGEQHQRDHDHQ